MTDPDRWRAATVAAREWAVVDSHEPDARDHTYLPTPPAWLQRVAAAHQVALHTRPMVCRHLDDTPTVAHICAWRPGAVCCTRCANTGALDALATLAQALTCDVCGHPGTFTTIAAGRAQVGPFVVHFSVHDDCAITGPPAAAQPASQP